MAASLIPTAVSLGDVVKVEADADLEGLTITTVFAPKGPRKEPEVIQLLGSGRDIPLVTQVLVPKGRKRSRDSDDRKRDSDDRKRGGGRSRDGGPRRSLDRRDDSRDRSDKQKKSRPRSERPPRREAPKLPDRPRVPRLRPARTHRKAALEALPALQHALAEVVLRAGVPGVRQAVEGMNEKAVADGIPKIKALPLVTLAEKLAPSLKAAEWRDRAEAAVAGIDTVDLRDIRSVVVAADNAGRDDETRSLADQLRVGLAHRVEAEHRLWLNEIATILSDGRTVRALRLSSRPPKAGAPLPLDMAEKLAAAAAAALTSDVNSERFATVIDAVAFSPVRAQVKPVGIPASPSAELLQTVKKFASRLPQIAILFEIVAPAPRKRGAKPPPTPPPPPPAEVTTEEE